MGASAHTIHRTLGQASEVGLSTVPAPAASGYIVLNGMSLAFCDCPAASPTSIYLPKSAKPGTRVFVSNATGASTLTVNDSTAGTYWSITTGNGAEYVCVDNDASGSAYWLQLAATAGTS